MLTPDEWRERIQLCLQVAENETTPAIKRRLTSHAQALAQLAKAIEGTERSHEEPFGNAPPVEGASTRPAPEPTDPQGRDSWARNHRPPTRLILVEDESIVALNLRDNLSRLGYEICGIAASGEDALRKIEQQKPDLVLMDIHIDGELDGIETAARIPPELHIPVIYLSAFSEETTLARARLTSPGGYLLKPFSGREIHASIQMALARGRATASGS